MKRRNSAKKSEFAIKMQKAREYSYLGIYEQASRMYDEIVEELNTRIIGLKERDTEKYFSYQKLLNEIRQERSKNNAMIKLINKPDALKVNGIAPINKWRQDKPTKLPEVKANANYRIRESKRKISYKPKNQSFGELINNNSKKRQRESSSKKQKELYFDYNQANVLAEQPQEKRRVQSTKPDSKQPSNEKENDKQGRFLEHFYPNGDGPDTELIKMIETYVMTESPNVSFKDIAGLNKAKEVLTTSILCSLKMKNFFRGLRKPPKGILLYGPAGTGKTMLAKAIATTGKTSFFMVNPSTLASKWKGDSEKMVRLLFQMARFYAPTTIFIDEIDSLLSERSSTENEASRKVKVQFFIEIDGIASSSQSGDQPKIFILGATNRPWDLDEAILRRLSKRIYIPLPTPESRKKLFQLKLKNIKLSKDIDYDYLVEKTHLYNSDDIEGVCREASLAPFKRKMDFISEDKSTRFFNNMEQEIMEEEITMADLKESLENVKPSASVKYLNQYEEWTKEHASV